ncbi:MAG TPA: serine/threonine-protein kinase [Polyangiaceae bacterium]
MDAGMDAAGAAAEIGRYRILRHLGQGAMGRVLLAQDPVLDREVAIKLLRDDLKIPSDQKAALVKRMRQEARASARVRHPNIVALHDMGESAELGLYLVFEYAEGTTLKQRLEHGALKPAAAARLAREIGSALSTAHRAGVLHRDIKPDNIILTENGAKIADFGIARVPDSTLTKDGGLLGTPAYSSPESIARGTFSPLSDQFSMAATLYEAVAGVRAYPGQDAVAVATKISTEAPPPIAAQRGLSPKVDEILSRALSRLPEQRYPSAREFGEAFAEALEHERRTSLATIPDQRHVEAAVAGWQRSRTHVAVGGAAVGVLLTIAAFQLTARYKPEATGLAPASAQPPAEPPAASAAPRPIGWLAESPPKPRTKAGLNAAALEAPESTRASEEATSTKPKSGAGATAGDPGPAQDRKAGDDARD